MKTAKGQWIMRLFIVIHLPKNKEGTGKIREEDQESKLSRDTGGSGYE